MENNRTVALEVLVQDGVDAIKVSPDRWYVAREVVEKNYHKYSKGWHRHFGPSITVTGRAVVAAHGENVVLNPSQYGMQALSKVVLGDVLAQLERWPAGGMLAACVNCVPFEDLLLLVSHPSEKVCALVQKRYIRGK